MSVITRTRPGSWAMPARRIPAARFGTAAKSVVSGAISLAGAALLLGAVWALAAAWQKDLPGPIATMGHVLGTGEQPVL